MKIPKISSFVENYKYKKQQKELQNLVNLERVCNPALQELSEIRGTLANYAKAKNIRINIYNPQESHDLMIHVIDNNGIEAQKLINGDSSVIETVERTRLRMLENSDGLNYLAHGVESHEDNFIRKVYRTVEILTGSLKK